MTKEAIEKRLYELKIELQKSQVQINQMTVQHANMVGAHDELVNWLNGFDEANLELLPKKDENLDAA